MMDGMMGMMHGWGLLVILLLAAILVVLVVMAFRTAKRACVGSRARGLVRLWSTIPRLWPR
jgi:uncharacterized membrane protein